MSSLAAPSPPPFLADALRVILPGDDETSLLRALLLEGATARAAWQTWCGRRGDVDPLFAAPGASLKPLLPLLAAAVDRNGLAVTPAARSRLRTAHLHEELRAQRVGAVGRAALATLTTAGIVAIAAKGLALTADAYPAWALRHTHDIDILVARADLARAAALLGESGLTRRHASADRVELLHVSHLPVHLHAAPFRLRCFAPPPAPWWARRRVAAGVPVLAPADAMVHVCGQAACSGGPSLQWVCDAWFVLARHADLDWRIAVESAAAARLALPLWVQLAYLADALGAAVPRDALAALGHAAANADRVAREAALTGARSGRGSRYRDLLRASTTWAGRAFIARWLALPSPALLRAAGIVWSRGQLPTFYMRRALRFAKRAVTALEQRSRPAPRRARRPAR